MGPVLWAIIVCGLLSLVYGAYTVRAVMAADAGTPRMQEIAGAIQEGAQAYLTRQYSTIAIAGAVIFLIVAWLLGLPVAIGFLIGAVLSGTAGFDALARGWAVHGLPRRRGHRLAGGRARAAGRDRLLLHPHGRHATARDRPNGG